MTKSCPAPLANLFLSDTGEEQADKSPGTVRDVCLGSRVSAQWLSEPYRYRTGKHVHTVTVTLDLHAVPRELVQTEGTYC